MIIGVGIDILNQDRMLKILQKEEESFNKKVLSKKEFKEYNLLNTSQKKTNFVSKKFSSKESFLKALGIGMGRGIKLTDISILHTDLGAPYIELNSSAKKFIEKYFKLKFSSVKMHLNTTDNGEVVVAVVIVEKLDD